MFWWISLCKLISNYPSFLSPHRRGGIRQWLCTSLRTGRVRVVAFLLAWRLVPAHASLRCGSSSNRFHTFARDIRELPHLRALPDTRALSYTRALPNTHAFPDTRASPNTRALSYTHASPSWLKFSSFSM